MKWINYSRYTGEDFGIDAADLMRALSDFFLESGFQQQFFQFSEWNPEKCGELKEAIRQALLSGELFDPREAERMAEKLDSMSPEELDQLVNRLLQKLVDEGYLTVKDAPEQPENGTAGSARWTERSTWRLQTSLLIFSATRH